MTTPKLEPGTPLPCPFCGGEPKRLNDGQGMSVFQCQKCTACHIRTFNNEAAFERWNTRHPDPRQQEKIEALVKALERLKGFANSGHAFIITDAMPKRDEDRRLTHKWVGELLNDFLIEIQAALAEAK